ncbi:MAG: DinB family protein [Sphingobacteriaceae bacterium]|nr:DinB family protein [Sphingobacteriaceae bacterium]
MEAQKQLVVKSVLDAWNSRIEAADKLFNGLTDEQLQQEIAPGRNRGIYLLGHLTAVHDKMLPLLDFEEQVYPHLDEPFLHKADKTVNTIPSTKELRENWKNINAKLATHFNKLNPTSGFKSTSVSGEDFAKEPHRNRINVVVGRTNHMQYHIGQVALLKK